MRGRFRNPPAWDIVAHGTGKGREERIVIGMRASQGKSEKYCKRVLTMAQGPRGGLTVLAPASCQGQG